MAYNPLEQSYLATMPQAPPVMNSLQLAQLQQSSQQIALNKQIQAENAYKLKAMAQDQQDAKTLQDLYLSRAKPVAAAPAISSDPGNGDFGGEVGAAAPPSMAQASPAPVAPAVSPWGNLDEFNGVAPTPPVVAAPAVSAPVVAPVAPIATPTPRVPIFNAVSPDDLIKAGVQPRNVLKFAQEQQAHMKAALEMTAEQRRQTKEMHDAVGQPAVMALQATDPKQQDELWDTTVRIAKDHGEDLAKLGIPEKLPADPKDRETVIKSIVAINEYGAQVQIQADQHAKEQRDLEATQRQKDADKRAQDLQDTRDASAQLSNAANLGEFNASLDQLRQSSPNIAGRIPAPPAGAPDDPLPPEYVKRVRRIGMTPQEQQQSDDRERAEQDRRDAALATADDRRQAAMDRNRETPPDMALKWARAAYPNAPESVQYDQALKRLAETTKEGKIEAGAPAADKKAQATALAGYEKAKANESTLTANLEAYTGAIDSGNIFVEQQPDGRLKQVPMAEYTTKNSSVSRDQAIDLMKQQANQVRDKIVSAVQAKKDQAEKLGHGDSVDVDAARKAMEGGKYQVGNGAAPAVAAAKAAPAPSSRPPVGTTLYDKSGVAHKITGYTPEGKAITVP